jgi:uncharacterized Rossmann fold enzyme
MRFEEWEPYYIQILDYFGFSRAEDERAAHLLQTRVPDDDFPAETLPA